MKKTIASIVLIAFLSPTFCALCAQALIGTYINGEAAGDKSGTAISLSADGTRVAIGAPFNVGNGPFSGHFRVYELNDGTWVQLGIDINGISFDQSGNAISLSADGGRVAVGSSHYNQYTGRVRIYDYIGGEWQKSGADIKGEAEHDEAGSSVSLTADGSRVAIGSPGNSGNGNSSGNVRVFEFSGNSWVKLGANINGEAEYDHSGRAVSLSKDGNIVAIASTSHNSSSGQVQIYEFSGGSWVPLGTDIEGHESGERLGTSISLSGNGKCVAIGVSDINIPGTYYGHVRIYNLINNEWTQVGQNIDGAAAYDFAGSSVSLSEDGTRVAVGAPGNDENGPESGHVRLFELINNEWLQVGKAVEGYGYGDYLGSSVSLSPDGTRVAIGSPNSNGNDTHSGRVGVYSMLAGEACNFTVGIDSLFHQEVYVPHISGIWDNTMYITTSADPINGWECFGEPDGLGGSPSLERTIWYAFRGDGDRYKITTVPCNASNYIGEGNTQIAVFSGKCTNLSPVVCNEDDPDAVDKRAAVELETEVGVPYYVLIDGFGPNFSQFGAFCVEVTRLSEMSNTAEESAEKGLTISPNPVSDQANFSLDMPRVQEPLIVLMLDALGRTAYENHNTQHTSGRFQLNVQQLPCGVYTLYVTLDGQTSIARLLVAR